MNKIFIVVYNPKDIPAEWEGCTNTMVQEFSNIEDAFIKMVELRKRGEVPRIFTEITVGVTLINPSTE